MLILIVFKPSNEEVLLDNVESVNTVPSPYEETEPNLDSLNTVLPTHVEINSKSNVKTIAFEYPPGYVKPKPKSKPILKKKKSVKFKCNGRKHCSQMRSYAEAVFFLRNCPGVKMDGDGDGIPCERQFGRR